MAGVGTSKRIALAAYSALAEALAVVYWNKRPFESFMRNALRDYPELLARLDFGLYKRETTAQLVDLLAADERRYQELTLGLMFDVSAMESFPNLRSQTEAQALDRTDLEARRVDTDGPTAGLRRPQPLRGTGASRAAQSSPVR